MSQEGVVETVSNPTVNDYEDDSAPDSYERDNEVPIESNITKKAPGTNDDGEDDIIEENKDSSSEDIPCDDQEGYDTNDNKNTKTFKIYQSSITK